MEKTVMEAKKIYKNFGKREIIRGLSLTMEQGRIYGLIGRNGAGKSTIMKLLSGVIQPDRGQIFRNVDQKKIGCMIEQPNLYLDLTAYENLEIVQRLYGKSGSAQKEYLLELTGLQNDASKKVYQYSLGMKMRLGIAKTLVNEPDVLMLDEPLNGLDPIGVEEILQFLRRLGNEKHITILLSSHMLSELEEVATDYYMIANGQVKEYIQAEQLEKMRETGRDIRQILLEGMRE